MGSVAGQVALGAGLVAASFIPGLNVAVAGALFTAGIGIGLGGVSQALAPGLETPKAGPVNRTFRSNLAFEQIPYGRVRTGGQMVAMDRHVFIRGGTNPDYLDLVIVVSARRIEGFLAGIYVGDEWVPLVRNDVGGPGTTIDRFMPADSMVPTNDHVYARHLAVRFYDGTQVIADQFMIDRQRATEGYWTNDHRLRGYAYAIVSLRWNPDKWAAGIPTLSFLVDGVRVFDPRTTTTVWSDNVALCLADYLASECGPAGVGYPEIDTAALIAAANVCDEVVSIPAEIGTGTEKRYRLSTVISAESDWRGIAPDLALAMAGGFFRTGAAWWLIAGAAVAPTVELGPDDMSGDLDVLPRRSRRDLFNRVQTICRDAAALYQPAQVPVIEPVRYRAEDNGNILVKELDLSGVVASRSQALRVASIELETNRQQITASGWFMWRALTVQVGDVILLTSERMGWSAKPFRVVSWELDFERGVGLGLQEYCDAVYTYPPAAELLSCAPSTNLAAPGGVELVPFLTVTREEEEDSLIEWGQPSAFNLVGYDIRWQIIGEVPSDGWGFTDGTYIALEGFEEEESGFVEAGTLELAVEMEWRYVYRVRVRTLLAGSVYGDWVEVISFPND